MVRRGREARSVPVSAVASDRKVHTDANGSTADAEKSLPALIAKGLEWIAAHQNPDGGWGDTVRSHSNISTTMLCHAAFHAAAVSSQYARCVTAAERWIERAGGVPALRARYGKDKTFSIPILTHCALAGLVDWKEVSPLPFELACLPANFYKFVRLPVVSYALPALIAIGQVRHHFVKPWNPLLRVVRDAAIRRSLQILERIQPTSGGFLEATPLTSFVTMSLAGMGRADHPVVRQGVAFLIRSVRPDGSWPIDTNLATWVTTLSINALGGDLPNEALTPLCDWLQGQQYQVVHPYTNADPGGWAWTDLSGGVPDADDTPGAMLATLQLAEQREQSVTLGAQEHAAAGSIQSDLSMRDGLEQAAVWLLSLQNRDGGWPTFCRGWGTLPFDRSAPDLTAHAIRALDRWRQCSSQDRPDLRAAVDRGFRFLGKTQRHDGSWLPLWFGNQDGPDDENPTYGTARVLAAYRETGRMNDPAAVRGLAWLHGAQNPDGGWGGGPGIKSSVEETALATEVFLALETDGNSISPVSDRGVAWLLDQVDAGTWVEPSPIGFYFAKLWYFEKLYPMIFTVAALRRAAQLVRGSDA